MSVRIRLFTGKDPEYLCLTPKTVDALPPRTTDKTKALSFRFRVSAISLMKKWPQVGFTIEELDK